MFCYFMKDKLKTTLLCFSIWLKHTLDFLTWICPSGTHWLVYRVRPIKEVDRHKDSKIDLETKKEGSNRYSTRTLINLSPVAYIKSGRGAPRGRTQYLTDNIF
jgi:hypothetical protein